jgi:hypothetical protein
MRSARRRLAGVLAAGLAGLLTLAAAAQERAPARRGDLARYDARIKAEDRRHWAFQPVQRPAVPRVRNTSWVQSPIDAFVLKRLEERGWEPAPAAAPRALLRRVALDLTGLPPTPEEQEAFLRDAAPDAYERVVDRLLASPHHGERWGRHWLDLVRYAETCGYERDATKPHAWRYRDYVIRAFNQDKPFDRFVLEQLAGDELADATGETLLATGYYRLGPWDDEPADPAEDRFDQLDDMVSTTGLAFLGLTVGCARCHDHKFEPLTMLDYYRLVAIFAPLQRPRDGRTELDLPAGSPHELRALAERNRRLAALAAEARTIKAQLSVAFADAATTAAVGPLPAPLTASAGVRVACAQDRLQALGRQEQDLRRRVPDLPRGYFLHEPSPRPPVTHLLLRGKAARPGPEVPPGFPAVLVSAQPSFPALGERTSLRRLTLARWIASKDNPLTARVIVNRVWQHHFGEGLVRTPSDFGLMGDRPSHPELLDWLASWFVEQGWSLKKLHRLIVTSSTYRMSKRWRADPGRADPEDRLLWRMPYHRLEVEAIRDGMLAASGQLNARIYGPSMYPFVPREALAGHSDPDKIWKPFDERPASRRTVYAFIKRSLVVPMLEVLDLCETTRSGDRRLVTTVAPQALTLFNGDFVNRQARHLADRLVREAGRDPARQIERAYLLTLCRPPTERERAELLQFLRREADAGPGALVQMCRVILNLNEFVYPD